MEIKYKTKKFFIFYLHLEYGEYSQKKKFLSIYIKQEKPKYEGMTDRYSSKRSIEWVKSQEDHHSMPS